MDENLELMQSVALYIVKLRDSICSYLEDLKTNSVMDKNKIIEYFDAFDWCAKAIYTTKDIHKYEINQNFVNSLELVYTAIDNLDIVLLKDIFEYEILEEVNVWHEKIK